MGEVSKKIIQNRLLASESRLRSVFLAAPVGIGVVVERVIKDANDRLCAMTGYSRDELIGKNARIFYPTDDDYNYVGSEKYRQIAEKGTGSVETRWLRKDGIIFDVLLSSTPIDPSDLSAGVTFTAMDITEHKRSEEALENERTRFKIITQNAPFGILLINKDGNFTYLNPKFTEIFGYDLSDVPDGKSWFKLAYPDPEYREEVLSAWVEDLKASEPGEKRPRIYEVVCKDGSRKIIHFIPVSLKTGENIIACEDITKKTMLENQLRQAQKMESIGRLAGGIAHDFNNMLQAIIGFAELAMVKIKKGSAHDEDLIQISQAAQRAADLTRQLLAFARKQPVSLRVLDLNKTVASMLDMLKRIIGEDIKLVWKQNVAPCQVKMDPAQIDQILANLLVNA
ncbi:MAG: PAS domain-containing sensor histidine kinase, partial [Desulfobacteraceae bacterium]